MTTDRYRVHVYQDTKGEWRWTTYAGNGEKVAASSEGYANKGHALEQAHALNPGIDVDTEVTEADA